MDNVTRLLMQGAAGGAQKTYVDDLFNPYVYTGNGGSIAINSGINLLDKGGLVWTKGRTIADHNTLTDTVRGANQEILSNSDEGEFDRTSANQTFTTTGHTWNDNNGQFNANGYKYVAWSFRQQEGFFDIVEYTGNGSNRNISHNLGCKPGCIMIKRLDADSDWIVYHNSFFDFQGSHHYYLKLNKTDAQLYGGSVWNNTAPTATTFRVGTNGQVNENAGKYIAYVWAGGSDRTTATARSVQFDGSGDYLNLAASSDFAFGTSDFTIECWARAITTSNPDGVFQLSDTTGGLHGSYRISMAHQGTAGDDKWRISYGTGTQLAASTAEPIVIGQWYHLAYVRSSGVTKLYVNGVEKISVSDTTDYSYQNLAIGGYFSTSYLWKGNISNFRIVNGTAVYTSSFRPPTAPLTNITNTKILCCNNSSVTGSTVTPGTITSHGDPISQTLSPFDGPDNFTFGEGEDQNVIKCGYYAGNGQTTGGGPTVDLGWQPSFIMIKNANTATNWVTFDSIRGISNAGGGSDQAEVLYPNLSSAESSQERLYLTPTGFEIRTNNTEVNENNAHYLYVCIRSADGYVGKPALAGTDSFAMDMGDGSGTTPTFDSGFPVNFALKRSPASAQSWAASSRLTGTKFVQTNNTDVQSNSSDFTFDSNVGYNMGGTSSNQSWMWKRGQGYDTVCWLGDGASSRVIRHGLGRTPEMIWTKNRNDTDNWICYHKGLNGGTNPWTKFIKINESSAEATDSGAWNDTAPTATDFTVGNADNVNYNGHNVIAMLFASVDGISKVGSYTGDGSTDGSKEINLGFTPRFVILKSVNNVTDWWVFDTLRGLPASGNASYLKINETNVEASAVASINATSTGFKLVQNYNSINANGTKIIYYAHA